MPSSIGIPLPLDSSAFNSTAGTTPPAPSNELDKDAFLQLLVAQLRYQDPLAPSDPGDFMAQTAQFTTVETLEKIADQNEAATRGSNVSTASSLIGRTVTYLGADGQTQQGVVSAAQVSVDGITMNVGNNRTSLDRIIEISAGPTGQ